MGVGVGTEMAYTNYIGNGMKLERVSARPLLQGSNPQLNSVKVIVWRLVPWLGLISQRLTPHR